MDPKQTEVRVGRYKIDAIDSQQRLVEVQHAGLAAIRDKIADLLKQGHCVRLIKPVIANKWIVNLESRSGRVVSRRRSPKRESYRDIFADLLHFTRVFPHRNLVVEVPLLEIEECRVPKRIRRFRRKNYSIVDQSILSIGDSLILGTNSDLLALSDVPYDAIYDTAQLARWLDRPRWFAQQVAYVLKHCGASEEVGRRGNTRLYRAKRERKSTRRRAA